MSAPQARIFRVYGNFKGGNGGTSAPQARKFLGYMAIFKGKMEVRARRRRENFGVPDFSKLKS